MESLGYARWENFHGVIQRAVSLIRNGICAGDIQKCQREVAIGSGAVRHIVDYEIDSAGYEVLRKLTSSQKTNGAFSVRNETALFALVRKYCERKGLTFVPQYRLGHTVFDGCIDEKLLIEFDEPHHESNRQRMADLNKNKMVGKNNFIIRRFRLEHDIVDIILAIDKALHGSMSGDRLVSGAPNTMHEDD